MTDLKKQRIIYVLPGLYSGGIEKQFVLQTHYFDQSKFAIHLVTLFAQELRPTLFGELPPHIKVHRLNLRYGFDIKGIWSLVCLLKQLKPDIVVSSMGSANTFVRLLQPILRYKAIAREHNTYTDKKLIHKIRDHIGSYFSYTIVAVSKTVATYSSKQSLVPMRKFLVIYNGVSIKKINAFKKNSKIYITELRQELGISSDTKILLNVARLKPQKNHTLLINAFYLFAKIHPDYVLCIVGEGSEVENLRRLVNDLGLGTRIFLVGYRSDVFTFFAAARAFILTSDIEGFPNVAIEAMAFGLPVLSTKVAGIDEFLEEGINGFYLDRSPDDIYATIERLERMTTDEYLHMSKSAQATASQFSVENIVSQYENLFTTIKK